MTSNQDYISLDDAKTSIIEALNRFHPSLGTRAAEILYQDDRLIIDEQAEPRTGMMQCRPAGITLAHYEENNMVIPDFEKKYGPHFKTQENPGTFESGTRAVIDFEYTGTPESVLYLAHELGHAIADDIQNENGRSFRDFSSDEAEQQAYFIQNIYSHYSGTASPEAQTEHEKSDMRISWERVNQYSSARAEFEKGLSINPAERESLIIRALGGMTAPEKPNPSPDNTAGVLANARREI